MNLRAPSSQLAGALVVLAGLVAALEWLPGSDHARGLLRDSFSDGGVAGRATRVLAEIGAAPGAPANLMLAARTPSSVAVRPGVLRDDAWLVSLAIPEEDFHDPESGILANPEGRGRAWERVGWLSLFDGRELYLSSQVGVRTHGNSSRRGGRLGLRFVLRPEYGLADLGPDGPLDTALPVSRLLLRRSQMQVIGMEIGERIGALVPKTIGVRFVLNGELQRRPHEIAEYVARESWGRRYFGHDEYVFFRLRNSTNLASDTDVYQEFQTWALEAPAPLTVAAVAQQLDVDAYLRHMFTFLYCGARDWDQGVAILDRRDPARGWFWLHWDLDGCMNRFWRVPAQGPAIEPLLGGRTILGRDGVRATLMRRLIAEDPADFGDRLSRLAVEVVNHRLPTPVGAEMAERYTAFYSRDVLYSAYDFHAFFEQRGDFVLDDIARVFDRPVAESIRVSGLPEGTLTVDGYEYGTEFVGRYFPGQRVVLTATAADGSAVRRWRVNGEVQRATELTLTVAGDTTIEARPARGRDGGP